MNFKLEKKGYDRAEVDAYIIRLVKGYEQVLARQKTLIDDLKNKLDTSESKNKAYRDKENLISRAITGAVAKADEIDRLTQLKYAREMQQLKAFHDKWLSHYERILKKYPLDTELSDVGKFNAEMSKILDKARSITAAEREKQTDIPKVEQEEKPAARPIIGSDDGDKVFTGEDEFLNDDFDPVGRIRSFLSKEHPLQNGDKEATEKEEARTADEIRPEPKADIAEKELPEKVALPDYADRSPAGFSFQEALHPDSDLEDIMRDLGLLLEEK